VFTNASTASDGSSMTYLWKFSDGDRQQTANATKTFMNTGLNNVELLTTTAFGCKDSTTGIVNIFPNGTPLFSWDSVCTSQPMLFKNLSNENGSQQVNYNWDFNNGGPESLLKHPLPVTYVTPGSTIVTLEMTSLGCENDPKSVKEFVQINKPDDEVRYRNITVPLGSSLSIHVRDTVGNIYSWRPQIHLSNYSESNTEFYALSDDVKYLIDITDAHTCVTTDTLQMLVLKKTGFYLPTAFTPNGDGLNDIAIPYLVGMNSLKSFSVYNRWGILFSTLQHMVRDGMAAIKEYSNPQRYMYGYWSS
jgi:PKD repeat protein